MDRLAVGVGCVVCALLLLALLFYPATFSTLTSSEHRHQHSVVPDSGAEFDRQLEGLEREQRSTDALELRERRYEELSPEARSLFDRTRSEQPNDRGIRKRDAVVCKPLVVGCPGTSTDDLAPELAYDWEAGPEDAAVIVATDDGRYLFSTATAERDSYDGGWEGFEFLLRSFVVLPTAFFLLAIPAVSGGLDRRFAHGSIALGVALATVAIAPAYLRAYTDVTLAIDVQLLLGAALGWGGPLVLLVGYAFATGSDPVE